MKTDILDKHLLLIQNELVTTVKKIVETENVPVKQLKRLAKEHGENVSVFSWLCELKTKIEENNKSQSKIVSL